MLKRLICCAFVVMRSVMMTYGQLVPIQNVQSPEIANLGLYGQIPVSLYTGTPDISIPIYELKAGNYTLPISISYHLASVQPNRQYGVLGMGWNLMAGGYISRIANFLYDEKKSKNGEEYGYYYHHDKMLSVKENGENFNELVNHSIENENNAVYDICADDFYFNFCGYSGHFFLSPDGSWKVVSEQNIKVEFDPNNGGFLTGANLYNHNYDEQINLFNNDCRVDTRNWRRQAKDENYYFFNKFTLVTPDGCRYEFGGKYATEYSISYYTPNESDLIPTTWRLAKIITPDNRIIQFNYKEFTFKNVPIQCDFQYAPSITIVNLYDVHSVLGLGDISHKDSYQYQQVGWQGVQGYIIFPSVLESIVIDGEKVNFEMERDNRYNCMFDVDTMFYRNYSDHNYLFDPYHGLTNSDNEYGTFFKVSLQNPNWPEFYKAQIIRQQIREQLRSYYLKRIVVSSELDDDSIAVSFSYLDRPRKMLSAITFRGVTIDGTSDTKTYNLDYNDSVRMLDKFVISETDSWGYYSGKKIMEAHPKEFSLFHEVNDSIEFIIRKPEELYTKADVLRSITYPTGGKTLFEFEQNDYSHGIDRYDRSNLLLPPVQADTTQLSFGDSLNSYNQESSQYAKFPAGGLRIRQIQSLNSDGKVLSSKKYYYTLSKKGGYSSGIISELPRFNMMYYLPDGNDMSVYSRGGFWPSSLNNDAPIVGYSTVFEETFDGNDQSLGYTKYCFSNYDRDIYGKTHFDENSLYTNFGDINNKVGSVKNNYYTNRSVERGKLLSQQYFDSSEKLKKSIFFRYKNTSSEYILASSGYYLHVLTNPSVSVGMYYASLGWLNKLYTYNYLQESETDTIFVDGSGNGYQTRKEYEYNENNLPVSITERCSDGSTMTTSYLYSTDKPELRWLVDKHNLSAVIEKKSTYRSKTKTEKYDYSSTPDTNVPYLRKKSTSYDGTDFKTDYEAVLVDKYGNPVEIMENGMKSLLYWGEKGQLLQGRIDNFSNNQAQALGMMNAVEYSNNGESDVDLFYSKFFNLPPSSHMSVYNYQFHKLLESIVVPTGFTTYYKFDGLDRLREVYHYDYEFKQYVKRLMHTYDYHYMNNPKEE